MDGAFCAGESTPRRAQIKFLHICDITKKKPERYINPQALFYTPVNRVKIALNMLV